MIKKLILSAVFAAVLVSSAIAQTDLTLSHQIAVGMTYGNVLTAFGNPPMKTLWIDGSSAMELWQYPDYIVKFENGTVVSVEKLNAQQ